MPYCSEILKRCQCSDISGAEDPEDVPGYDKLGSLGSPRVSGSGQTDPEVEAEVILRNFLPLSATEYLTPWSEMTLLAARLAGTGAAVL